MITYKTVKNTRISDIYCAPITEEPLCCVNVIDGSTDASSVINQTKWTPR